jgi:hypothetical protein
MPCSQRWPLGIFSQGASLGKHDYLIHAYKLTSSWAERGHGLSGSAFWPVTPKQSCLDRRRLVPVLLASHVLGARLPSSHDHPETNCPYDPPTKYQGPVVWTPLDSDHQEQEQERAQDATQEE